MRLIERMVRSGASHILVERFLADNYLPVIRAPDDRRHQALAAALQYARSSILNHCD
ncbi:MAG: hypothetical protein WKF84_09350 [Pyrinomonadaceae bacterium]